jgi:hypothetical protein
MVTACVDEAKGSLKWADGKAIKNEVDMQVNIICKKKILSYLEQYYFQTCVISQYNALCNRCQVTMSQGK